MQLLFLSLDTFEHAFLDLRPLSKSCLLALIVLAKALAECVSDMVAVAVEADFTVNAVPTQ